MADGAHQEKPISLSYSYSHRDEELRKKLEDHLAGLRWSEKIAEWHDRNIDAGNEWAKEIDRNLRSADIILLLVSASFIASKYCWSVEMTKALERHDKGEAKVIPVILRPCSWHITPFSKLQAAPTDAKPVTSWFDPDEALYDVARKIERVVTDLQQQRRRAAEQAQQRAEAQKRQAGEEQKQDAQQRREQEEARRVGGEAEAARVPIVFTYSHDGEWLQQPKSERTAAARVADNQSGDDSRQALPSGIAAAIQKYAERLKVYFAPNIPDSKMQTGILEIHEQALALIDLKLFGSSANYIVFTQTRLYINSNRGGFSGSLKYSELTKTKILPNNQGVLVGEGRLIDVGWKNSDILFELFKELRRVSP